MDALSKSLNMTSLDILLGLGIIIIILAVIILIVLLIQNSKSSNNVSNKSYSNNSVDNAIANIVAHEETELVGDNELVAVITAAMYAYLGDAVPAEGLVVRSIRRSRR